MDPGAAMSVANPALRDRSRSMCVGMLREELPEWSWRAVRSGMGWRYEGHRGDSRVTVQAEAVLCGPADDDFAVRWKVYETGETYATWYCREIARLKDEGARDA